MYPASFEYLRARGIDEAIEWLRRYGDDAKLLAGGQSLVPMMKLRVARPKYLIDIHRIGALNYIREDGGSVHVGAMTRHVQIEDSPLIGEKLPILREAASAIGDAQVRNRGTIGGGLVEADPSGDYGAVVLALNAEMKCISPRGERVISAADFFTFAYTTALQSDEILTEVILPVPNSGSAGVYLKLERVAGDFAIASAAVQLSLDSNDACNRIGIGVTGAGTVPQQVLSVEILLRGKKITPELIDEAGRLIQEGAEPIEDLRGSAAYKKKALSAILRRAIAESLRRAEAKRSS
jgi:carbon-monoxide dehydrogenase medium subunit